MQSPLSVKITCRDQNVPQRREDCVVLRQVMESLPQGAADLLLVAGSKEGAREQDAIGAALRIACNYLWASMMACFTPPVRISSSDLPLRA